MKINITQELKKHTLLANIVMTCLTETVSKELIEIGETKDGIVCDLKLTLNSHELDLQSFIKHWESQVSRMIKEEATEMISEKFNGVNDLLYDLEERLKPEIEKRMEDWERETDEVK